MTNQDDIANNQVAPDHALHSEHQDADNSDTATRQQSVSSAENNGQSSTTPNCTRGPRYQPDVIDFSDDNPAASTPSVPQASPHLVPYDDEEFTPDDPRHEILLWHYRLGHVPFSKLQHMAFIRDLPRRLAKCPKSECAACRFGRAKGISDRQQLKVCT
jgi:GAG-pre-integrase domain